VFVSFLGYAKIATVGEELKNPGRNLPIAIIGSVAIVTVIYAILVTTMLGVIPWSDEALLDAPVAEVTRVAFPGGLTGAAVTIVTFAALLATASSANASILASARINFAMGRDGIVTDWLNDIHPSFATPYRSILVTGTLIVVFIVALGRDLSVLAKAASGLHLVVYTLTNLALVVFRETGVEEYNPDFEVTLIDISTLTFAGAGVKVVGKSEKALCNITDVGSYDTGFFDNLDETLDGYDDLVCHFVTAEIVSLSVGENIPVEVSGDLTDVTLFVSNTDIVKVVKE
jgi:amino acid transporter